MRNLNPEAVSLGLHLRMIRVREGFSKRTDFARLSGIPYQTVYDYEAGNQFPSIHILIALHKTLNISFEEILEPILNNNAETKKDDDITDILRYVERLCRIPTFRGAIEDLLQGALTLLGERAEETKNSSL